MAYIHKEALTTFTVIRPPARWNNFTLLAKASLPDDHSSCVLIQEAKHSRAIRKEIQQWRHILASEELANQETHLAHVRGLFTRAITATTTTLQPAAVLQKNSNYTRSLSDRPIHVVDYYEQGSLRDLLDQNDNGFLSGQSLSSTKTTRLSDCHAKLVILKDVATALQTIQSHMPGQSHSQLSSASILLDKNGHAFLTWHQVVATQDDLQANPTHLRYLSKDALVETAKLIKSASWDDKADLLDRIKGDDMYAFGVLAWELATGQLPFEQLVHPTPQQLVYHFEKRWDNDQSLPRPLHALIQRCMSSDKDKRPSWDQVIMALEAFDPQGWSSEESVSSLGEQSNVLSDSTSASQSNHNHVHNHSDNNDQGESKDITCKDRQDQVQDAKLQVVEMMESVLSSTFYRRELPAHLNSFTSVEGKRLFREMVQSGTGENFFRMVTSFNTQSDPAFCGVSSLSMVLNALEIDPGRQWRGVWRWYSDEQLDCCASIEEMKEKGITFNQFACLARCHAKVVVKRADRHTLEEFRRDVRMVSSSDDYQLVLSFSRAALGQTGSGHFSPIGGYHAGEDKVLVLDTARFKYPPFWATVSELWESLQPKDPETGLCRGYFVISATSKQKLEIQKQKLQNQASAATPSSSLLLPVPSGSVDESISRPNSPTPSPFESFSNPVDPAAIVGEGDHSECDCSCPKQLNSNDHL
ncbi:hypothetical protein BGZ94_007959 [Podila epigama]|nr:hypothetical protein BGZ94_007959 [Podila epigama]